MLIFSLIALAINCCYGIKYDGSKTSFDGYLSRNQTDSIKGIFILVVFLSHANGYIARSGYAYNTLGDNLFTLFFSLIGQLMVVMFLFYSGYGVMESIKKKGSEYVCKIPRRRVLNTLLNFDVVVFLFLIADLLIGKNVTVTQFLLSLIAWFSIGNSTWFIFVIILCYISTWIIASLFPTLIDKHRLGGIMMVLLSVIAIVLAFYKPSWWYDTILAYPAGVVYSEYKEQIEHIVKKRYFLWLFSTTVLLMLLYMTPYGLRGFKTNFVGIAFALWIVLLTMKINIGNRFLSWCGAQLFPMYIYQRIPMMIMAAIGPIFFLIEMPLLFVVICFIATLLVTI